MNGFLAAVLPVAAVWLLSGLITALVMGRRGHDLGAWMVLGVVSGPFAAAFAVPRALVQEESVQAVRAEPGVPGAGPVSVLVGIDGSTESREALMRACRLLGDRLGRLTLARVVDYQSHQKGEAEEMARADLDEAVASVADLHPEVVILAGPPAEALESHAREGGYDLLVVGTRGRGVTKSVLGSVATRLARRAGMPVLMSGGEASRENRGDFQPGEGPPDSSRAGPPSADTSDEESRSS